MSIIQGQFSSPDLKFVQLKNYQFSSKNDSGSGQCLTVDQNSQHIFCCCQNELLFVPLHSLLNFEIWSKDFLNNIDTQFTDKVSVKLSNDTSLNSHLVSISSKGYGTKIAVSCYDPSNFSLYILFYDIASLYKQKENSISYNRFNFQIALNSKHRVRMITWHPEWSDNIFACLLTDGSLYVIYVSDSDNKIVTLLSHLPKERNVTAFSWSPKGKQIVVTFKGSSFSQFKLQINEKNLVQNNPFQEVKKIQLPEDYQNFNVINICWISTFNFIIACHNPVENDTHYMLVSIPSSKATGADAIIKVIDFNCINIDSIENVQPLEIDFKHIENLIFTYTNKSAEFAILGCGNASELAEYNKWSEITLEDDNRLMLPMDSNEFSLICGLAFTHGVNKQIRFPSSLKGGPKRPYALTYNFAGQLTLFLTDYENASNENFLKIPIAPTNVTKPTVSSIVPVNNSLQNEQKIESNKNINPPIKAPPPGANVNLQKSDTQFFKPQTDQKDSIFKEAEKNFSFTPNASFTSNSFTTNQSNTNITSTSTTLTATKEPQSESAKVLDNKDNNQEENLDKLYVEEIILNIKDFDKELTSSITFAKKLLSLSSIGSKEEFEKIKCDSESIKHVLNELKELYSSLNLDISDLHTGVLELQCLLEETRSLLDRNVDPKYRNILKIRSLDPITSRKVNEINSLSGYIDVQLRELNCKFDAEWQEMLQKKRSSSNLISPHKRLSKRISSTSPLVSFIGDSAKTDKSNLNEDSETRYNTKVIYKALANNQCLIANLKQQIKILGVNIMNSTYNKDSSVLQDLPDNENVKLLSKLLNEVSLDKKKTTYDFEQRKHKSVVINIDCLPPKHKSSLKTFLENRHSVPVRLCGPCISDGDYSKKSRFISVLENIKTKKNKKVSIPGDTSVKPASQEKNISNESQADNSQKLNFNNLPSKINFSTPKKLPVSLNSGSKSVTDGLSNGSSFNFENKTENKNENKIQNNLENKIVDAKVTFQLPATKGTSAFTLSNPVYEDVSPASTPTTDIPTFSFSISSNKNSQSIIKPSPPKTTAPTLIANSLIKSTNQTSFFTTVSSSSSSSSLFGNLSLGKSSGFFKQNDKPESTSKSNENKTVSTTVESSVSIASPIVTLALPKTSPFSTSNNQSKTMPAPLSSSPSMFALSTTTQQQVSSSSGSALPSVTTTNSVLTSLMMMPKFSPVMFLSTPSTVPEKTTFSVSSKSDFSVAPTVSTTISPPVVSSAPPVSVPTCTIGKLSITSKTEPISTNVVSVTTTATATTTTNCLFGTTISSLPSFSSSMFNSEKISEFPKSTVSTTTTSTTSTFFTSPETSKSTVPSSSQSLGFSFNSTLSSLGTSITNVNANQSSSPFAQSVNQSSAPQSALTSSFSFATPSSPSVENSFNSFKICSPSSAITENKNVFGSFSFGGNSIGFSNPSVTTSATTSSFFSSPNPSNSIFQPNPTANLQQTPNNVPNQSLFAPSPKNTATPSFGSSPFGSSFGQPSVFGASTFGAKPTFGSGSPLFSGSLGQPTPSFAEFNANHVFGGFKNEPMPSFDHIINDNKPNTGFGSGSGFISTPQFTQNKDSFTQRRN